MGVNQREGAGEAGWVGDIALPYTLSKNPIKLKLS